MTPEQEAQVAEQLLYLIIMFLIAVIVLVIYGTVKRWNAKTTARIGIPLLIVFLFIGLRLILGISLWFTFSLIMLGVLAIIGWTVSIPKIRQVFLGLFDKKKK